VSSTELGTRVVVRKRIEDGFSDAVGYLRSCDETECVVETRHGLVSIPLSEIVAAKSVPPPPAPRAPRRPAAE
jgi:hypothetical protein